MNTQPKIVSIVDWIILDVRLGLPKRTSSIFYSFFLVTIIL